jgi:hypothetical protein
MTVGPLFAFRFTRSNRFVDRLRVLDDIRRPRHVRLGWLFDHDRTKCNNFAFDRSR